MSAPRESATDQPRESAVEAFLDKVSLIPPQPRWCLQCGREIKYRKATFSLFGTKLTWQVLLPVCACELEDAPQGPTVKQ